MTPLVLMADIERDVMVVTTVAARITTNAWPKREGKKK